MRENHIMTRLYCFISLLLLLSSSIVNASTIAVHTSPFLFSSEELTELGYEPIDDHNIRLKVETLGKEYFPDSIRFSPFTKAKTILAVETKVKSDDSDWCVHITNQAGAYFFGIGCDSDIDDAIDDAFDALLESSNSFYDLLEKQPRINWLKYYFSGQPPSFQDPRKILGWSMEKDRVRKTIVEYFYRDLGRNINFATSSDLIRFMMDTPESSEKYHLEIIEGIQSLSRSDRMLPYYAQQAVRVSAKEEVFKAFKKVSGSFEKLLDGEKNNLLMNSVVANHSHLVEYFLSEGISPDNVNKFGHNAIHFSCGALPLYGSYEILETLISAGGSIESEAEDGGICLTYALSKNGLNKLRLNGVSIVKEITKRGGSIHPNTPLKELKVFTPLMAAIFYGDYETAKYLIELGANVNQHPLNRETALHLASTARNMELARKLIQAGADINVADKDGRTPLHYAFPDFKEPIKDSDFRYIKLLITNGARESAKDNNGLTPQQAYSKARANYLEEQRIIAHNKRMQELREERIRQQQRERERQERRRKAQEKRNGFQWGKLLALGAGFAIGQGYKLDAETQVNFITGAIQDSMGGVQGTSNAMAAFSSSSTNNPTGYGYSDYADRSPMSDVSAWNRDSRANSLREANNISSSIDSKLASIKSPKIESSAAAHGSKRTPPKENKTDRRKYVSNYNFGTERITNRISNKLYAAQGATKREIKEKLDKTCKNSGFKGIYAPSLALHEGQCKRKNPTDDFTWVCSASGRSHCETYATAPAARNAKPESEFNFSKQHGGGFQIIN